MNFTFRQIRYFIATAESGQVSQAAVACPNCGHPIAGDAARLSRLVAGLLDNAVRYTAPSRKDRKSVV